MSLRSLMLAGTILAVALPFAATAQQAATPAPAVDTTAAVAAAADDIGADIIVTAQKRPERLQDVPVAVSVINGAALAATGKVNLEGAQYLVPSLNFLKSGTTLNQSLFLRGVGTATFSIAGEPSVSTVLDGVVLSRAGEAFSDLVDVERIEVLRGPQGTLFGKNASAGVINIVSVKPGDVLGGYVEASYFSAAEYRLRAAVDVPFSSTVRARVNGFYDDYKGNIFNVAPTVNRKVNGFEHYGVRAIVEGDATETLKLTAIGDYHRNNDDCCAEVIATPPLNAAGQVIANPTTAVLPAPLGVNSRTIDQNLVTRTKETGYGFSLQGDLNLGDFVVTSITAYRNYKNEEIRDGDFLPAAYIGFNQLHDDGPQTGDTFSQEFRLTSPADKPLTYVLGAYYSNAKSERIFTRTDQVCGALVAPAPTVLTPCTSPLAAPSTFPTGTADFGSKFENLALFGQGTYRLLDNLRLIGGLRYTHDKLDVFETRVTTLAGPGINPSFDAGVFAGGAPNGVPFRTGTSKDNVSGKAGVQYDISHGSTAYATYARGYKGPAYNVFYNLTTTGTNVIEAETSNAYEIGLKNTLLGGKLTVNLAGYLAKYHNFQANNPDLAGGVVVTRFTNAGDVSTRGGELDLLYRPVRDLSVTGGLAYTDAHVDKFKIPAVAPGAAAPAVIAPGTPLGFAPKWKGSLGADYRIRTDSLPVDFFVGAQGSFQSSELALFAADAVQRRLGTIGAYGLVNLQAGITDHADKYKLTFQVRNLFDKAFAAAITNGGPGGSYRYQIPRDADRYYGVTGRVNF
ncbi:TonB-dependent receptor [Polymorphobacter sp. PAMC 29334]|uniref:TonB-dependent receptor n=1 Tax=Polymorphobacter sp. PAMC 29334 TaxID=2862331 RepID=UPI001C67FC0B|nr:TonB-dependent receptor [Polymorphobacter sp. PAMC 29334]QYE34762.1 TonB-dependent receptor [Polymorphobacter sp. PAMC 29334]